MRNVIVHDTRLAGDTPRGPDVSAIRVDLHTSLADMVQRVASISLSHGTEIKLSIMCHGYETNHELGYGLQLCREDLTLATVPQLAPLQNWVSYGIDIYSCGAAATARWRVGQHGDGFTMCSRLARTTRSIVRAAELTQTYFYFGPLFPINFGGWEGTVYTWNARGEEIDRQVNPSR